MELTPADQDNQLSPSPNESSESSGQLGDAERWGSLITGGTMVLMGLRQRSLRGVLLALAGGGLAYHGASGQKSLKDTAVEAAGLDKSIRVEKSVTIHNKSPEELYRFWRNFENLPTFMKHLRSIAIIDNTRSHWVTEALMDQSIEWDAEIVRDEENTLIAWTSVEGSDIENSGFVRFQLAPPGRGTEVKVVMEYTPPAGELGAAVAKLFGKEGEQQLGDELSRFKMLMEAGEIATTDGQTSCRESEKS